jgi:hypothetical protein
MLDRAMNQGLNDLLDGIPIFDVTRLAARKFM